MPQMHTDACIIVGVQSKVVMCTTVGAWAPALGCEHCTDSGKIALQPEGLSQVADLVSFYKENATILREVGILSRVYDDCIREGVAALAAEHRCNCRPYLEVDAAACKDDR
jgi:hypothetical protein